MDEQPNDQLILTAEERAVCARVAGGEAPHAQRAQAVLALADGANLAAAAAKSGLTENQVKLWRGRFRNGRVAIFPEDVQAAENTPALSPAAVESLPALAIAPTKKPDKKEKKKDKDGGKKKKDRKKDNGKKKSKKKKKDKKDKKGKSKKG